MGKIEELSLTLANQIAAGEVVEKTCFSCERVSRKRY